MKIDLLTQARMWKEEADKLFADSKLFGLLNTFGNAITTGRYKHDRGPTVKSIILLQYYR